MIRLLNLLANLFPLWIVVCSAVALVYPPAFTWFSKPMIIWGLGVVMLGMGITLSLGDFRRVLKMPKPVALGVGAQFLLMPLLGWGIAHLLALPRDFAVGLILVACCPGGTASNVVAYIARANVALSVLMTMCSTIAAIALTPLLTGVLAGAYVPVDGWGMLLSIFKIVLLPIALGVFLHHKAPKIVDAVLPIGPLVSVVVIVLICASVIAKNSEAVIAAGGKLLFAVVLLHVCAFTLGYFAAKIFGYEEEVRRTVAIEVGMQNSGLAIVLAGKHFAATAPLATVPGAISASCHSIIGSICAAFWRSR